MSLFDEMTSLFDEAEEASRAVLVDSKIASWVRGAASVPVGTAISTRRASPFLAPPEPPDSILTLLYPDPSDGPSVRFPALESSIGRLSSKSVVSPAEFRKLGATARRDAFTITAKIKRESLVEVRDLLAENVARGASVDGFIAALEEKLPGLPISPTRMELVFRNNTNEAFAQGQEDVLADPIVAESFPYRAYDAIRDGRVRVEHLAMEIMGLNGTNVFHKDDPTWARFRPPWDHNCRCAWTPLSIDDAAAKGVQHAKRWLSAIASAEFGGTIVLPETVRPALEFVDAPPFNPPVGFDRGPQLV